MDCKVVITLIEDFRENRLDSSCKEELLDHLGHCKSCRQLLAGLDVVDVSLKAAFDKITVSPQFTPRVTESLLKIEIDPKPPMSMLGRKQIILAAAACFIACLSIGYYLAVFRGGRGPSEPLPAAAVAIAEPTAGQPYAIGREFVIGDGGGVASYSGKGHISIKQVQDGVPELIVEAFPKEKN